MDVPQIIFNSEKKKPLRAGNKEYISLYDFSLTEKEIEKAREELFETEEKQIRKLQELRDLLANDKDVNYRTDTPYLLSFLRVRKYDSAKAYQSIKEAYIFKKKYPEFFNIPANLEQLLNQNILRYLPYTDEEGRILFHFDYAMKFRGDDSCWSCCTITGKSYESLMCNDVIPTLQRHGCVEKWKLQETSVKEVVQIFTASADIIYKNPRVQINGLAVIFDTKGLTSQHLASILSNFKLEELSFFLQNLYPRRLKTILLINTGVLTRLGYKMMQPFLRKKFSERVLMLGYNTEELHKHLNPMLLPQKLGGFLKENQCNITQNIINNISYIRYERSFTSTENI